MIDFLSILIGVVFGVFVGALVEYLDITSQYREFFDKVRERKRWERQ